MWGNAGRKRRGAGGLAESTQAISGWQKSAYISSDETSDSLSREHNFRTLTAEPLNYSTCSDRSQHSLHLKGARAGGQAWYYGIPRFLVGKRGDMTWSLCQWSADRPSVMRRSFQAHLTRDSGRYWWQRPLFRITGCIYAVQGHGERWPQIWRSSGGASGRQSILIGGRHVIRWHRDLEVTEGDGGVAESDAEHLSCPPSNRALPQRSNARGALSPLPRTATRSSSCLPIHPRRRGHSRLRCSPPHLRHHLRQQLEHRLARSLAQPTAATCASEVRRWSLLMATSSTLSAIGGEDVTEGWWRRGGKSTYVTMFEMRDAAAERGELIAFNAWSASIQFTHLTLSDRNAGLWHSARFRRSRSCSRWWLRRLAPTEHLLKPTHEWDHRLPREPWGSPNTCHDSDREQYFRDCVCGRELDDEPHPTLADVPRMISLPQLDFVLSFPNVLAPNPPLPTEFLAEALDTLQHPRALGEVGLWEDAGGGGGAVAKDRRDTGRSSCCRWAGERRIALRSGAMGSGRERQRERALDVRIQRRINSNGAAIASGRHGHGRRVEQSSSAPSPSATQENLSTAKAASPLWGALDRFGQFFISPLFLEDTVDREIRAVDSENKKNLQADTWRLHQLNKNLSNPEHPYNRFSTGNWSTLHDEPLERALLGKPDEACGLGREDLDTLEEWVEVIFSEIPNKDLTQKRWDEVALYTEKELLIQTFARPVMDSRTLELSFLYRDEEEFYESHPSRYLSHLIGHERGLFNINVKLTEDGLKHYHEIVKIIFQYIAMVRELPPQQWVVDEMIGMSRVEFTFKQKSPPSRTTSALASVMQKPYPRKQLLSGLNVIKKFDAELISQAMTYLRPDNFRSLIVSQDFSGDWDKKEQWYGTYKTEKIPQDFLEEIKRAFESKDRPAELHIPHNEFVPTRLDVEKKEVEQPLKAPKLIRNHDKFWVPKANVNIHFRTPMGHLTPPTAVMSSLYRELVIDALVEYSYDADISGLV
ncbi:Metalloenzyme, LuxS/M16 peptidase-like protein [Clohesyomyces aquaticus]|uniref:Metalloenzyme, LuxS/M16 peptidase-like protein n=1 Tax=Clohesyomyces aquaticus TaxID=1231657 RepID=A0A1Y2A711_9PLEO|nr:Metalloenzyme, LuxS/M16 peptidase-like protein [Clohesyomyces aquaticus]